MSYESHSILVISNNKSFISKTTALLVPPVFELDFTDNYNDARCRCQERIYNIILIDYADGQGLDLSIDLSGGLSTIVLFTKADLFDQISYHVETSGILTAVFPFDTFYFYNIIKIAIAVQFKVQILSSQAVKLKESMEEIRIINRAKMILMQKKSITEEEAHHYLEKEAMNQGEKKIDLAKKIIRQYS